MNKDDALNKPIPKSDGTYSELKVLRSNAGYYIGRTFMTLEGWEDMGSRESDYFKSKEEAEEALTAGFEWRDASENRFMYGVVS
jgi:hypothetical protein